MGPLAGGAIIESISWQWIFWVNVPVGLALLPIARRGLVESHGPAGRLDLPGVALATTGLLGIVYATVRGNELGWEQHDGGRLLRRRRGLPGPVRPLGAPRPGADAPAAVLPLARLRRHLGRLARDVVRHLRLDLPAGPVLPDRQGLRAARGRAADAALDRHADARRPDRRRDVRPHRLAPADGGRAGAAGRRDRVAGGGHDDRRRLHRRSSPPSCSAAPAWRSCSRPSPTRSSAPCEPHEAGQASGANNAIRELGGVLGVAVLAAVFSATGGYESGEAFVDGLRLGAVGRRGGAGRRRRGGAAGAGPRAARGAGATPEAVPVPA